MSLQIDVRDSCNGNPITDATFGVSVGSISASALSPGWYYVTVGQNTDFICGDQANKYYPTASNTGTFTSMTLNLLPTKSCGW